MTGLGRLAMNLGPDEAPGPWWRPDWNRAIVANASARTLRTIAKVGKESGRWPVAVHVDALYYAAPAGDPLDVAPTGLSLHQTQLGKFKTAGQLPLTSEIVAALDPTNRISWVQLLKGAEL